VGRVTSPRLRGTWLGTVLRLLNPFLKRLLASPLHPLLSRFFMLLGWTGRKTGRTYTTPVSYVREGDRVFVTTGDRWWRNLVGGGQVRLRIAGRSRTGMAVPLTDREESIAGHARLFRERPFFRRLAGLPAAPGGGADPADVARAVDAGRMLVRIDLD
jgi:deazaflavin-dependent oxidoreductase (nitroreductase family)